MHFEDRVNVQIDLFYGPRGSMEDGACLDQLQSKNLVALAENNWDFCPANKNLPSTNKNP